jgi:putative oxidoreductase
MKSKVYLGSRLLLGVIYFVFGLNGFLQFLPMPPLPEGAMSFMGGLASSGYFFPFLKGTEVVAGLLLLTGFAAPLALIILAPITLNIFLFHFFLTPGIQNSVFPIVLIALQLLAAGAYWHIYSPLFTKGK